MTDGVGSTAVTDFVECRRAAEDEKIPPPQPMSRYLYFVSRPAGSSEASTQELMKS